MAPQSRQPALGSEAVHNPPANSRIININAATCLNLSLFKELMREYRKVDDTVTMRMNRVTAQFRDRDRAGMSESSRNSRDQACSYFWTELVENWKKRKEIIHYCVNVVDQSIDSNRKTIEGDSLSPEEERKLRATSYAQEVTRNQMHNELAVEAITRQRSIDAFKSRCRYFEPPLTDAEARVWWEASERERR